jgi:hypothetical protein
MEDSETMKATTLPPKLYAIVPWQVYLDVRESYREVQDS